MNLFEDLKWRGLVKDITDESLIDKLNNGKVTFYIGTDPTADSLHIGHYSSFLISKRLFKHGHRPILLVGGGTGMIGDPKPNAEREIISREEIDKNIKALTAQAKKIFGFEVVNNYDWLVKINVLDFLRDYGKYFNVSYMLAKDKVKSRLESGITYAEFSYMIIQALDFLYLYEKENCILQVAGSDQWGNITSGVELIKKKINKTAYGMVSPLITDSNGVKFGKSEGNAVWLDINKTSGYKMYQYLVNLEDSMIIEYLKKLTFLSKEEIENIEKEHLISPEKRLAHHILAKEVICDIHGSLEYEKAVKISETLFSGNLDSLSISELKIALEGVNSIEVSEDINIIDSMISLGISKSKSDARKLIESNSIAVNSNKINDFNFTLTKKDAKNNEITIIKKGKKHYYAVYFK